MLRALGRAALLGVAGCLAVLAALGATAGAGAGEFLFDPEDNSTRPLPRSICLLFDTSGSMKSAVDDQRPWHSQLLALTEAAEGFVERQDLDLDSLGLVSFASAAHVQSPLSQDGRQLIDNLGGLRARGATDVAIPASPQSRIAITVAMAEARMFTRLLPISISPIRRSGRSSNLPARSAPL